MPYCNQKCIEEEAKQFYMDRMDEYYQSCYDTMIFDGKFTVFSSLCSHVYRVQSLERPNSPKTFSKTLSFFQTVMGMKQKHMETKFAAVDHLRKKSIEMANTWKLEKDLNDEYNNYVYRLKTTRNSFSD